MAKQKSSVITPKVKASSPTTTQTDAGVLRLLSDIQQKINSSSALNGGFDTLMYKVDKIEESQGKMLTTVDEIKEAIYDPDSGLFSRISEVKQTATEETTELDKKLISLDAWKTHTEKDVAEDKSSQDELGRKVAQQQTLIDDVQRWRSNVTSIGKWASVALGGGVVTLLFKLAYDFVTNHWKLKLYHCS